ncbi:MAG: DUF305 domain-containing protein [Gemmatimonadaceae bacterium]
MATHSTDPKPASKKSPRPAPRAAALLAILALATACAGARRQAPAAPANDPEAAAIARARTDSARHPYTTADIHFMSAMIDHHSQALAMTALAPTRAASNSVKILAERIASSQRDEIALAETWLRDRGQHPAHDMSAHGGHDTTMPGMLSAAQTAELAQTTGAEFDRLFLAFMIQHHRGSLRMVNELFATDGAAQDETVFRFASDVNVDQATEIARMEQLLTTLAPRESR